MLRMVVLLTLCRLALLNASFYALKLAMEDKSDEKIYAELTKKHRTISFCSPKGPQVHIGCYAKNVTHIQLLYKYGAPAECPEAHPTAYNWSRFAIFTPIGMILCNRASYDAFKATEWILHDGGLPIATCSVTGTTYSFLEIATRFDTPGMSELVSSTIIGPGRLAAMVGSMVKRTTSFCGTPDLTPLGHLLLDKKNHPLQNMQSYLTMFLRAGASVFDEVDEHATILDLVLERLLLKTTHHSRFLSLIFALKDVEASPDVLAYMRTHHKALFDLVKHLLENDSDEDFLEMDIIIWKAVRKPRKRLSDRADKLYAVLVGGRRDHALTYPFEVLKKLIDPSTSLGEKGRLYTQYKGYMALARSRTSLAAINQYLAEHIEEDSSFGKLIEAMERDESGKSLLDTLSSVGKSRVQFCTTSAEFERASIYHYARSLEQVQALFQAGAPLICSASSAHFIWTATAALSPISMVLDGMPVEKAREILDWLLEQKEVSPMVEIDERNSTHFLSVLCTLPDRSRTMPFVENIFSAQSPQKRMRSRLEYCTLTPDVSDETYRYTPLGHLLLFDKTDYAEDTRHIARILFKAGASLMAKRRSSNPLEPLVLSLIDKYLRGSWKPQTLIRILQDYKECQPEMHKAMLKGIEGMLDPEDAPTIVSLLEVEVDPILLEFDLVISAIAHSNLENDQKILLKEGLRELEAKSRNDLKFLVKFIEKLIDLKTKGHDDLVRMAVAIYAKYQQTGRTLENFIYDLQTWVRQLGPRGELVKELSQPIDDSLVGEWAGESDEFVKKLLVATAEPSTTITPSSNPVNVVSGVLRPKSPDKPEFKPSKSHPLLLKLDQIVDQILQPRKKLSKDEIGALITSIEDMKKEYLDSLFEGHPTLRQRLEIVAAFPFTFVWNLVDLRFRQNNQSKVLAYLASAYVKYSKQDRAYDAANPADMELLNEHIQVWRKEMWGMDLKGQDRDILAVCAGRSVVPNDEPILETEVEDDVSNYAGLVLFVILAIVIVGLGVAYWYYFHYLPAKIVQV